MKTNLPQLTNADLTGKNVLVRVDLDVPSASNPRVDSVKSIMGFLKEKGAAKIKAVGHRGDYGVVEDLKREFPDAEWSDGLRDDPREKDNGMDYATELAAGFDVYINEAFAVSHRKHASIVSIPKVMKESGRQVYLGLRFEKEIEMLSNVFENEGKKVLVIGGAKAADKAAYAVELATRFEKVVVGGMLAAEIVSSNPQVPGNMVLGKLRGDGLDIDEETVLNFKGAISGAAVIVVAGPMGRFEDEISEYGTRQIFGAVVDTDALTIAGGGNTEDALSKFNITNRFGWVSVGGGAMLQYLAKGTLPGIEAVAQD